MNKKINFFVEAIAERCDFLNFISWNFILWFVSAFEIQNLKITKSKRLWLESSNIFSHHHDECIIILTIALFQISEA